jgi:pSer/pThr/pTyr-binding forkhead associated (FHA) protein
MENDKVVTIFSIEKDVTFIGRLVSINDIVLKDPFVSRQHALIKFKDNQFIIYDFNSSGGVLVNNERVKMQSLNSGDEIKLGHTVLIFKDKKEVTAYSEVTELDSATRIMKLDEEKN